MTETVGPIRVLHVLGRMQRGGAEMRILEIMGRLRSQEFRVDVCAHSGLSGALDDHVRACGGDVIPVRLDAWFPARFVHLLRRRRYSVVHSHILHTSGVILALAAMAGVPVRVAHVRAMHDGRRSTLRRRVQRQIMLRLIDRYATDIVGCAEGALDAFWGAGWRADRRCRIIYNTVDPARFAEPVDCRRVRADLGIPARARLFVHVGNKVAEKNHRRLLAIFAEIRKTDSDAWLVLAGEGTDDSELAREIHQLGIQDCVAALGIRDDIPRLLKAADALLLPSLAEGMPGAVLEACAAGVPVLASDLPGVREIASRLSLVRYLPLSVSDADWAMAASKLPDEAERLRLRNTAADLFRASVFHVDHAVEAHRALWMTRLGNGAHPCS